MGYKTFNGKRYHMVAVGSKSSMQAEKKQYAASKWMTRIVCQGGDSRDCALYAREK